VVSVGAHSRDGKGEGNSRPDQAAPFDQQKGVKFPATGRQLARWSSAGACSIRRHVFRAKNELIAAGFTTLSEVIELGDTGGSQSPSPEGVRDCVSTHGDSCGGHERTETLAPTTPLKHARTTRASLSVYRRNGRQDCRPIVKNCNNL